MRRLFTKSTSKGDGEPTNATASNGEPLEKKEPTTSAEAKKKVQQIHSDSEREERRWRKGDHERGDTVKSHRRRRRRSGGGDLNTSVEELHPRPSKRNERHDRSDDDEESESHSKRDKGKRKPLKDDETDDDGSKLLRPKPKPRPRPKLGRTYSDMDSETDYNDDAENLTIVQSKPEEVKSKGKKRKEKILMEKGQSSASLLNDSSKEEYSQFLNKDELEHLIKVEPGKGNHYLSSTCNYKKPVSTFKVRARLLKYPTFSDRDQWPGDFAVVDERVFGWQEKVFSVSEAKKYQNLENCITEREKEYHEKIKENPGSVGKYLYTYVSEDSFVTKKKERMLVRRCPVPHIRKSRNGSRYAIVDAKSGVSDDESLDADLIGSGSESIDFDDPISSSTPKTKRKEEQDKANVDRKETQRKEKESKELEQKNRKMQEAKEKREKLEEKKRQQREAKEAEELKKLKEAEDNEKEIRKEYMKKYKYSKRPSLPLGARLRSVQLSPSPRKLSKRQKSRGMSRSSEFSTDYQEEDEKGSEDDSSKSKKGLKEHESESFKTAADESSRALRRVGYERGDGGAISSRYKSQEFARKSRQKFQERFSYKNSQVMYIMASIPHLPGRYREVVVSMIRNVPNQGILVFKPALGYRNIEAKRNHLYRLSCEQFNPYAHETSFQQGQRGRPVEGKTQALDDFMGLFELVPRNELRVTVMGEITTLEGFDMSPLCVYYVVDIPKGWRNDSVLSNTEGITHTCYTDNNSVGHLSHEFSFHLSFSMDSVENGNSYPCPVIAFMVVSMKHLSPRIIYEGYGYLSIPMTPGSHYINVKTWKPRPRTIVEKMRAVFLNITPSLQDMKFAHIPHSEYDDFNKANLIGLQTEPSGSVKFRLHVMHQTPTIVKSNEKKLDLLEKMSSATILKSVQAVIEAFQRAREKAATLKNQYQTIN